MPSYEAEAAEFAGLNAQVLGISVDHIPSLEAWAESLGGIKYPLLSDFWPHGEIADLYGVMRKDDGFTERAIFVIDTHGYIRYIDIHDINDRPDNELLRQVLRDVNNRQDETGISGVFYDASEAAHPPLTAAIPHPLVVEPTVQEEPGTPITLYCARWCKDCRRVKEWFDKRGLTYIELDIDLDREARNRIRGWANGFLVTPVLDICGTVVLDFNIPKIEEALREHGLSA